uniref:Uncharacterized protein n=1 Tax=viral metagenome TaxID=1070528 RepID=A0A6M3L1F5_9ZZZZ
MIVDELIKLQKQKGLNNQQFAESIGIHKQSWYRNKRTKIIDAETLLSAVRIYPELREAFLALAIGVRDTVLNPYETHHKRNLTAFGNKIIVSIKKRFLHH